MLAAADGMVIAVDSAALASVSTFQTKEEKHDEDQAPQQSPTTIVSSSGSISAARSVIDELSQYTRSLLSLLLENFVVVFPVSLTMRP